MLQWCYGSVNADGCADGSRLSWCLAGDLAMPSNSARPAREPQATSGDEPESHEGTADSFQVRLEQYEGPLDALLDLVKKQRLDILDIPIARITEQYLASVRRAESLNFELSSEFVLMASTLIHIKSKMLLPVTPTVAEAESEEDPREDLVQRLLEREKFLQAAQMLKEKRIVEENVWTAGVQQSLEGDKADPAELQVSLFDLVKTFGDILERLESQPVVELSQETVTVGNRIRYLKNLLLSEEGPVQVRQVLLRQRSAGAVIATFLALLEMVKAQAVALRQHELFGEILIERHTMFDEAFQHGDLLPESDSDLEYSQ